MGTTRPLAFIISALMLAGCGRIAGPHSGRYQIVVAPDNQVWKIDSQTGQMWLCGINTAMATGYCNPVQQNP